MERIMPVDIDNIDLPKAFRGYAVEEVDEFKQRARETIESLLDENDRLKSQIAAQQMQIEGVKAQENTLKEALILAQRTADETKALAYRAADAIREEARQAAVSEKLQSQREADDLKWEVEKLRTQRSRFNDEFRALLDRYQRDLGPKSEEPPA